MSLANQNPADPLSDRLRCCWGSGACHFRAACYVETSANARSEFNGRQWMCAVHAQRTLALIAEQRSPRREVRS